MNENHRPRLIGVLVTFRRPELLSGTLDRLARQDRRLDRLIVVDNEPSVETRSIVDRHPAAALAIAYLPTTENVGFAGGVAAGMAAALKQALDEDWLVVLDDDDPPPSESTFRELEAFGMEMLARDQKTAAVGLTGARFDWRRGRIRRVPDSELHGAVPVDYIAGDEVPFYLVRAVREVGPFWAPLFFGLSEIEFGLRLRRAGHSLYGHGELWLRGRRKVGRLDTVIRPSVGLPELTWRRYYSLRNTIHVLRSHGHRWTAIRVTVVRGIGKPLANLLVRPRAAGHHLALNWKACLHGWTGHMGRVIEPDSRSKRGVDQEAVPV